ncbi:DEAD/DEAH box helicase family protein [Avibacterium paragallinarum]|uniref:type I restriction endonuclease subunit R n=1 Tax=Avibacterium paragallinarum TaxID=728 RepID=UPI0021F6E5F1|nr:DEAD/DEAH box helicase family protein [Avibacterium paragallinarum]UXN34829.1 DEAD/DEAH box helicase family protein [Avibacterium paragallinarum]
MFKKESEFEQALIEYLSTGNISSPEHLQGLISNGDFPVKSKIWEYKPEIKTTEQLWDNFKAILERLNAQTLQYPLSVVEFNQVKQRLAEQTRTPFEAGKFLYGINGVSQIEIDLDDGRHVFLTVFDQKQIGAGNTVYQVVNQIERPKKIAGKQDRRFDVTLLINGLPIIQIELKNDSQDVYEALEQMRQYTKENQYQDIFSTLQILIAMTPHNARYMANTTAEQFNTDFAFMWQKRSDNSAVRQWKEFADSMLSIPMAHQMATNYMILDGTPNKQMLKVMRSYQVYATQAVIEGIKHADFEMGDRKIGYIWHTTGSGKTITSFKTAWLASRLPKVDKVVFVVDRIALTNQTLANYRAYDPDGDADNLGTIRNTNNTRDLRNKLKSKDNSIIITSVQKLGNLVSKPDFTPPEKNIVFIVDEAHRSTAGDQFSEIQYKFKRGIWVGYTGTPTFDNNNEEKPKKYKEIKVVDSSSGKERKRKLFLNPNTEDIFGKPLHTYTIREAIEDRNVLGFKVEFKSTVDMYELLKQEHPDWSEQQLQMELDAICQQEFDEADFLENSNKRNISKGEKVEQTLTRNFYDHSDEHIRLVVEDIFKHWRNRSNDFKYNALFTTHVSGGGASTPLAIRYYNEFQRVNKERSENGEFFLKVAITYSLNTSNSDTMTDTNEALHQAIKDYNATFGTNWGLDTVSEYFEDLSDRLNKKVLLRTEEEKADPQKAYLDLVIVVDQLLTGFDAPHLNTLYVDRILKGSGLIQAYSRTNRIANKDTKPWGQVVNYRWPVKNERLMNEALATYANKDSSNLDDKEIKEINIADKIIAEPFSETLDKVKSTLNSLAALTKDAKNEPFKILPAGNEKKIATFNLLKQYSAGVEKLKQYPPEKIDGEMAGFDYDNPEALLNALGLNDEQEGMLIGLNNELKRHFAKENHIPIKEIELRMTHIKDIKVDYDYLTELINQLIAQVQAGETEQAKQTEEKIHQFANGMDDTTYATKIRRATQAIMAGDFPAEGQAWEPIQPSELSQTINAASTISIDRKLLDFRNKWGITDIINNADIYQLIANHRHGEQDLDDGKVLTNVITQGSEHYTTLATNAEVQKLSKIKYRTSLRQAFYELADGLVRE